MTLMDRPPEEVRRRESLGESASKLRKRYGIRNPWWLVIVAIIAATVPFAVSTLHNENKISEVKQFLMLRGYYAMDVKELKEIVRSHNLVVYWAGPEPSNTYALDTSVADRISLRYLRNGHGLEGVNQYYRAVMTYPLTNAYSIVMKAGTAAGGYSFKNMDGNSVYFNRDEIKNVYLGLKNKDIEIEIYDKSVDQSLAIAMTHNGITQIK